MSEEFVEIQFECGCRSFDVRDAGFTMCFPCALRRERSKLIQRRKEQCK